MLYFRKRFCYYFEDFALFNRLEKTIESNYDFVRVNKIIDRSFELVRKGRSMVLEKRDKAEIDLRSTTHAINNAQVVVKNLKIVNQNIMNDTS